MSIIRIYDSVLLLVDGKALAGGTILKVRPDDMCGGVTLGIDRVAIILTDAFDTEDDLPYPTGNIRKIKEAVDSLVIWDRANVSLLTHDNSNIPDSQETVPLAPTSPLVISTSCLSEPIVTSTLTPASESGRDGDEVDLFWRGCKVGNGIVHHVEATKTCHNVKIGSENISVRVHQVLEGHNDNLLPFPHAGANTLGEAIGGLVKWPKVDVCKVGEWNGGSCNATQKENIDTNDHSISTNPIEKEKHFVLEDVVDYTKRQNWHLKDVHLYCPERLVLIAIGKISVPQAIDVVNDMVLGYDHVGVTLIHIHRKEYFVGVAGYDSSLVAWPIHCVKLVDNGRFLGEITKEAADDSDESTHVIPECSTRPKRAYHSTKRTKMDPEARRLRDQEKKKYKKMDIENINLARGSECCNLKCCQNTTVEDFLELRSDYWLASFANRKTYILSHFHNRSTDLIAKGRMVLKNCIVCKRGFHDIFGFSHTQFYKYERFFQEGQKVGVHGNEGQMKTRENTLVAKAMMENILNAIGEPMPHLIYNGSKGTNNIEYRLPSSMTMKCVLQELFVAMAAEELPLISKSTFYDIWGKSFANYKVHDSSAFSKCEECLTLKTGLQSERRAIQRAELESKRALHLCQQMSRRHLYYSARIRAKADPENHICIIHDKMDQHKTHLPRMADIPKSLSGRFKALPISLTGIITHGRDPGAYAHYGLTSLWEADSDFTVTSIAKCLRDLEDYRGDKSGHLGNGVQNDCHPIFHQLLDQNAFEVAYLARRNVTVQRFRGLEDGTENVLFSSNDTNCPERPSEPSSSSSFKRLPKHLVLQLDNSPKDNKNQTVMAFCSDLVARGIFETVTMSFLMVGHTHEDIDVAFSCVSKRLFGQNIETMAELMAEVWDCMDKTHMVPAMITEVADYKAYLKRHKVKHIVGQSEPMSFRFFMIGNKPCYQYKASINSPWMPETGRCMWATDEETLELIIPVDDPFAKKMSNTYAKMDEVVPFIRKYIEYHSKNCTDETSEAYRLKSPVMKYWKNIADTLEGKFGDEGDSNEGSKNLPYGFWPRTNHGTGYKSHLESVNVQTESTHETNREYESLVEEFQDGVRERSELFVGPPSEKKKQTWNPLEDIKEGSFVCLNPNEEWAAEHGKGKFWLVRALGKVQPDIPIGDKGEQNPCFYGEWWRPKHREDNPSESIRYNVAKILSDSQYWERDPGFQNKHVWHKASATMYSWVSRGKPESLEKME